MLQLTRIEVADLDDYNAFHTEILGTLAQVTSITTHAAIGSSMDEPA